MNNEDKIVTALGGLVDIQRHIVGTHTSESLGEFVCKHENLEALLSGGADSVTIPLSPLQTKAAITSTGTQNSPLGGVTRHDIAPLARRKLYIRDLLPVARANDAAIEYPVQSSGTSNAGVTVGGSPEAYENVIMGESAVGFTLSYVPVRTLGHFIPVSKQVLQDSDVLSQFLSGTLIHNLRQVEESQLLTGTGVNGQLTGIIPGATAYTISSPVQVNSLDIIADMIEQLQIADFNPSAIVMHPTDFKALRTTKAGASDVTYANGDPQSAGVPSLWGLPVAVTNSIASGTVCVADFAAACTLFDREEAAIEISRFHSTNFQENMVTMRAVERIALVITQSGAVLTASI